MERKLLYPQKDPIYTFNKRGSNGHMDVVDVYGKHKQPHEFLQKNRLIETIDYLFAMDFENKDEKGVIKIYKLKQVLAPEGSNNLAGTIIYFSSDKRELVFYVRESNSHWIPCDQEGWIGYAFTLVGIARSIENRFWISLEVAAAAKKQVPSGGFIAILDRDTVKLLGSQLRNAGIKLTEYMQTYKDLIPSSRKADDINYGLLYQDSKTCYAFEYKGKYYFISHKADERCILCDHSLGTLDMYQRIKLVWKFIGNKGATKKKHQ